MSITHKIVALVIFLGTAAFWLWPESPPDYAYYARTGDHPMLPKYELQGDDYYPPFADRLGKTRHWLECDSGPMETISECVRRTGCFTDSDCLEWESWLARNE